VVAHNAVFAITEVEGPALLLTGIVGGPALLLAGVGGLVWATARDRHGRRSGHDAVVHAA
jgi:hypothetical protein